MWRQCVSLWKLIQRQLLSCLSARYGLTLCVAAVFLTILTGFHFGESMLEWSQSQYSPKGLFLDNIAHKDFEERMCLPVPIDIVYTWVNGSDPKLLEEVARLKILLEVEKNRTAALRANTTSEHPLNATEAYTKPGGSNSTDSHQEEGKSEKRGEGEGKGKGDEGKDGHKDKHADGEDDNEKSHKDNKSAEKPKSKEKDGSDTSKSNQNEHNNKKQDGHSATKKKSTSGKNANNEDGSEDKTAKKQIRRDVGSIVSMPSKNALSFSHLGGCTLARGTRFEALKKFFEGECGVVEDLSIDYLELAGIVSFTSEESAKACVSKNFTFNGAHITMYPCVYFANVEFEGIKQIPPEIKLDGSLGLAYGSTPHRTVVVSSLPPDAPTELIIDCLNDYGNISYFHRSDAGDVAVVTYFFRFPVIDLLYAERLHIHHNKTNNSWNKKSIALPADEKKRPNVENYNLPVYGAVLIGPLNLTEMDLSFFEGEGLTAIPSHTNGTYDPDKHLADEMDELSSSRFQDNSELQYSLRSVEKYAPWVRHIYIVTNGQIPSWLNLDHPRITLVPHDDIFVNKSHLPTFSSSAIETHIHRIPGLSKRFIYLNDDVMFGIPIWPDDFYTHAKGQKVFLAWPVPSCVDGCPSNWLGDKYCDKPCNVSACDYDGGDCLGDNVKVGKGGSAWQSNQQGANKAADSSKYCAQGCADSWMGDRYCDKACNNLECAMDAGDCGMASVFAHVHGFVVQNTTKHVFENATLVSGNHPRSVYFNMSEIFPNNVTVTDASYTDGDNVNTVIFNQEYKTLIAIFKPNLNDSSTTVTLLTAKNDSFSFEIFFRTAQASAHTDLNHGHNLTVSINMASNNDSSLNGSLKHEGNVVSSPSINFWVFNGTARPPAPKRDKSEYYKIAELGNDTLSSKKVPFDVLHLLQELDEELKDGDITIKGYAKKKFKLLEPYFPNLREGDFILDVDHEEEANPAFDPYTLNNTRGQSRVLLMYERDERNSVHSSNENWRHLDDLVYSHLRSEQVAVVRDISRLNPTYIVWEEHDPLFLHPGLSEDDMNSVIYIENAKRKQLRYEHDLAHAVALWEDRTGELWSEVKAEYRLMNTRRSFLPWERMGYFEEFDELHVDSTEHDYLAMEHLGPRGSGSSDSAVITPLISKSDHLANLNEARVPSNNVSSEDLTLDLKGDAPHPWRQRSLKMLQSHSSSSSASTSSSSSTKSTKTTTTKAPLDTFGESLKMVNRIYNKHFGFAARKVIAHMPHFIDRDIIEDCQQQFWEHWDRTSSHKFRSGDDMQYAFAYMYYMMSLEKQFNVSAEFHSLDTDQDGLLSVQELRTLITRLYPIPTSYDNWLDFEAILLNCSSLQEPLDQLGVGVGPDSIEVWVTEKLVSGCDPLLEKVKKWYGKKTINKFELESDEKDVAFKMIRNNASKALLMLDSIRKDPKKFICLNDNIDHRKASAGEVVQALHNFYTSMFPIRSAFELPVGYRNRFQYMSDLRAWHQSQVNLLWWSRVALVLLFLVVLAYFYGSRISAFRRAWLQRRQRDQTSEDVFSQMVPASSSVLSYGTAAKRPSTHPLAPTTHSKV